MAQANPTQAIANIYRTPELWDKIVFTFICLVVYRVGSFITVPGVDVTAMLNFFQSQQGGGFFGLFNLFVGGNLSRSTIFALGIMPYISASIFAQIAGAVIPQVEKMQKDEEGRKKITQWTRYGTIGLALVQAWGYALFTESVQGAVSSPGFGFKTEMAIFLTTGAIFVMWLGEQITERGLGSGASLMIFFSIVERFIPATLSTFQLVASQGVNVLALIALLFVMAGVVAGVVVITLAARRIQIQIPQRTMGRGRMREAAKNFIPLRINAAGVMPIIFAQSLIVVPGALATFSGNERLRDFADYFQPGTGLYFVLMTVLIILFTYFYTAIVFNPVDLAENL
jgi:preprotein translocase subunit SecY